MKNKPSRSFTGINKKELIDYIKIWDPTFVSENFSRFTETQLVILKVSIELKLAKGGPY